MAQHPSAAPPSAAKNAEIYDRFASLSAWDNNLHLGYWDDPGSDLPIEEAANRLTDLMADTLVIGPDSHVLDVGCGVGGPAVRIARRTGARVTGISISSEQVRLATALAESAGLGDRVVFRCADAMDLPFPEASFDAAIAIESMSHMPDREHVLTGIARLLRPGGRVALTDGFLHGEVPEEKWPALHRFLDAQQSVLVQAEDYPPMLRRAGLWFEQLTDVTPHTLHRSWTVLSERFTALQSQLDELYTADVARSFDTRELLGIAELGYLLVVAIRPGH